jgi:hypothetical protein
MSELIVDTETNRHRETRFCPPPASTRTTLSSDASTDGSGSGAIRAAAMSGTRGVQFNAANFDQKTIR